MSLHHFRRQSPFDVDLQTLFAWHERPGALERLIPPWDPLRVLHNDGHLQAGARVDLLLKVGPVPVPWRARHTGYKRNSFFRDEQERGPFRQFIHTHGFREESAGRATLIDTIDYELPLGPVGDLFAGRLARQLHQTFNYRHHLLAEDLRAHQGSTTPPLTFLISGATGVVGRSLIPFLTTGGHRVITLVRQRPIGPDELFWNPLLGELDLSSLQQIDVVIHLAGENIATGRWHDAKKRRILESRVLGTRLLAEKTAARRQKPQAFLSASAIGFYGHRQDEILSEKSPGGMNFISRVCAEWEGATQTVRRAGVRVALLRIGVALTPKGGALQTMLGPARLGIIGPLGTGSQYMSWIAINDLVWAIHHIVFNAALEGPINICAPTPLTNREFVNILAAKMGRRTLPAIPAGLVRLCFGAMADEIPLASTRVRPEKLLASGFGFRYRSLDQALDYLLSALR